MQTILRAPTRARPARAVRVKRPRSPTTRVAALVPDNRRHGPRVALRRLRRPSPRRLNSQRRAPMVLPRHSPSRSLQLRPTRPPPAAVLERPAPEPAQPGRALIRQSIRQTPRMPHPMPLCWSRTRWLACWRPLRLRQGQIMPRRRPQAAIPRAVSPQRLRAPRLRPAHNSSRLLRPTRRLQRRFPGRWLPRPPPRPLPQPPPPRLQRPLAQSPLRSRPPN